MAYAGLLSAAARVWTNMRNSTRLRRARSILGSPFVGKLPYANNDGLPLGLQQLC